MPGFVRNTHHRGFAGDAAVDGCLDRVLVVPSCFWTMLSVSNEDVRECLCYWFGPRSVHSLQVLLPLVVEKRYVCVCSC